MILLGIALAQVPPPVANGTETDAWPAVGAFYAYSESADGVEVCTGALFDDVHVLTAAHCAPYVEDYAAGGFRVYFLTGPSVDAFTGFTEVESIAGHPDWSLDDIEAGWDIGVATLVSPVSGIEPLPLGDEALDESWVDVPVRLVGWGNVDLDEAGSGVKREGEATIDAVRDALFLTAPAAGGAATCPGDSGAPVIREDGGARIVGVVSWSTLDSSADHPCGTQQGHARVDVTMSWIEQTIAAPVPEDTGTPSADSPGPEASPEEAGCGCHTAGSGVLAAAGFGLLATWGRRRRWDAGAPRHGTRSGRSTRTDSC